MYLKEDLSAVCRCASVTGSASAVLGGGAPVDPLRDLPLEAFIARSRSQIHPPRQGATTHDTVSRQTTVRRGICFMSPYSVSNYKTGTGGGLQGSAGPTISHTEGEKEDFEGEASVVEVDAPGPAPGGSVGTTTDRNTHTPLHDVAKKAQGQPQNPKSKNVVSVSAGIGPGGASQQNVKTKTVPIAKLPSVKEVEGEANGIIADIKGAACDRTGWSIFCK